MPLSFINDSVIRQRATVTNKNGMEVLDWSNPTTATIKGVQVTALGTTRIFDGRTLQIDDRRTLRAPYDADIKAGDRIVWHGNTYEIEGDVFRTKSPTGRVSSTRCTLVRWCG